MRNLKTVILAVSVLLVPSLGMAHTAIVTCEESDGKCWCRGFFSDMSVAAGATVTARDDSGKVVFQGKVDEDGEVEFSVPVTRYQVFLDAGEGHEAYWEPEE
jgi:hypothetical protein